jgi:FKBP-type peptidyl-prolyl cis-trans isomerase SlyD
MSQSEAKVVSLSYELRQGGPEGDLIESVHEDSPVEFLVGAGRLIPRFEEQVKDLGLQEPFEFTVGSAEAYGPVNDKAIVDLPKSIFMVDGKPAEDLLEIGKVLNMEDQEGNPHRGQVIEIGEETVKMDFNHPLAGLDLHFKGKVLQTRPATEEEVAHGHVHTGKDGH